MLKSKFLPTLVGAAVFGVAAAGGSPAHAMPTCTAPNCIQSPIDIGNFGSTGNFATLTVQITSAGNATLTFDAGTGFSFLNNNIVNFNSNTVTTATSATAGIGPSAMIQNVDGFGTFNFEFDPLMGSNGTHFPEVVIDVTGSFDSNAALILAGNPTYDAAAHLIGPNTVNGGATFFGAETVPAPLIGHGLFVLLSVGGVLFGGKFLERSKKHPSLGIGIPDAA